MKRELKLGIIKLGTIICGILWAINTLVPVILRKYIEIILLGDRANGAVSIGIIGGADGPTSIFIASTMGPVSLGITILLAGLTLAGCITLWVSKKRDKQ